MHVSNDLIKHIHESVQKDDDVLITLSIDLVGNHISQVCRWLRYPASRTKAPIFFFFSLISLTDNSRFRLEYVSSYIIYKIVNYFGS